MAGSRRNLLGTNGLYISAGNMSGNLTANYTNTTNGWVNMESANQISFAATFSSTAEGQIIVEVSSDTYKAVAANTALAANATTLTLPYVVSSVTQTQAAFEVTTAHLWVRLRFVKSGSSTGTLNVTGAKVSLG